VHAVSAAALMLHESMLASLSQLHLLQPQNAMPTTQSCNQGLAASCSSLFCLLLGLDRSCLLQADEVGCLLLLLCRQADLAGAGCVGGPP